MQYATVFKEVHDIDGSRACESPRPFAHGAVNGIIFFFLTKHVMNYHVTLQ